MILSVNGVEAVRGLSRKQAEQVRDDIFRIHEQIGDIKSVTIASEAGRPPGKSKEPFNIKLDKDLVAWLKKEVARIKKIGDKASQSGLIEMALRNYYNIPNRRLLK